MPSKTRDPHGELAAEIDYLIARAEEVNAPAELVQKLEDLKRSSEGSFWDTSSDVVLSLAWERLSDREPSHVSPPERTLERIPESEIEENIDGFAQQGWVVSQRVDHPDGSATISSDRLRKSRHESQRCDEVIPEEVVGRL